MVIRLTIDENGSLRLLDGDRVVKTCELGDPEAQRRAARRRARAEVWTYLALAGLVAGLYTPFVLIIYVLLRVMFP